MVTTARVLYSLMGMFCADCKQILDDVELGAPCPGCGGDRRNAEVFVTAALAAVAIMEVTVEIGYNLAPGWTYQWRSVQLHLDRLREQYRGVDMRSNTDVEETVHALFLALHHLWDWLYQDSALSLDKATVLAVVDKNPKSLGLCRAYANTRKHVTRDRAGARIAQITKISSGPAGQTATIGHRAWDQPTAPYVEIDALTLAEQSERDWRDWLSSKGILIPA